MSSEEQNLPDAKDDLPNDEQGIELSLDQLSQAYAQVMREQGASEDEPEIEPLDVEGTSVTGTIPSGLCNIYNMKFDCSPTLCGCYWCPCSS